MAMEIEKITKKNLNENYIEAILENFNKNRFVAKYFPNKEDVVPYLLTQIQGRTVGLGDSKTLWDLGVYDALSEANEVADPMHPLPGEKFRDSAKRCLQRQVFISSVNAFTETGMLVNVDGTGNRVAGTLFGSEEVYFVMGINKLCKSLDEALFRVRNIAAPQNTQRKHLKTPCAIKGDKCYDCYSPDRICNALVVYYKKMRNVKKMEIIIVGEELGF